MEQYVMPKELDFENLRLCLDNYKATNLFIRDCGGIREDGKYDLQGLTKVKENLENKNLDFKKDKSGLYILIDTKEVFHFPLKSSGTREADGFSLAYERIKIDKNGNERLVMLGRGENPYDPELPEPRSSILRHNLDHHLLEIDFKGRIDLKFHSWWIEPDWKYWTIDVR